MRSPLVVACISSLVGAVATGPSSGAQPAPPVSQPQVDLGETSFLDGEAGQGALLEVIGDGTTTSYFTGADGRGLPGRHKLWSAGTILHPAYVSNLPVLGGHLGVEGLLPLVLVHSDMEGTIATTQGGVGDITLAPFVEWSGVHLLGRALSVRLAVQAVFPTGSYSPTRTVNAGQNSWQLSPYVATTFRVTPRWEISNRLIYDWSSRNTRPAPAFGAASTQAGDQVELNLSASYAAGTWAGLGWRIGLASYALRQLDDAKVGDARVPGSRQQAFGLGPGFLAALGSASVIGTAYREFGTENRPEGFQAVLRLLQPF